ncbi:MAG: hypothetical protein B7Z62_04930 [Deltaproteobacteria bacterium 37-65-8]|nr:MAG: hypothetical protein B7Z62_04930 [Deltaproteobacteria bacterium 37-65-8]
MPTDRILQATAFNNPDMRTSFLTGQYFLAKPRYGITHIFKALADLFLYVAGAFDKFAGDLAPLFDGPGCASLQLMA